MNRFCSAVYCGMLMVCGCGNICELHQGYEETWVNMRYGLVTALPAPDQAEHGMFVVGLGKHVPLEDYSASAGIWRGMARKLDEVKSYGRYTVRSSRDGQALLLDEKGAPIWAGEWILPARVEGRVVSLYLFRKNTSLTTGNETYKIWRLYFGHTIHTCEIVCFDGYIEQNEIETKRCNWLVDFDSDGTDELVVLRPDAECADGLNNKPGGWVLEIYALGGSRGVFGVNYDTASQYKSMGVVFSRTLLCPPERIVLRRTCGINAIDVINSGTPDTLLFRVRYDCNSKELIADGTSTSDSDKN